MATLISKATGNFTTNTTWAAVAFWPNTSEVESTTANVTTSNQDTNTFTPAASQVDALLVKIGANTTPTGTVSVTLRNSTTATNIATVTVNVSDLPATGWVVLPITAHTPNGTDQYVFRIVKSSSTGTLSIYTTNSSSVNWICGLRLVGDVAPAASDKLIIAGQNDGSTISTYTVTMDNTATTSFGPTWSTSDTISPGGIQVCKNGKLDWSTAGSTAFVLKWKGRFIVYDQGVVGTVSTRIASTSSLELIADSAANVDSGIYVSPGGTFYLYGDNGRTPLTLLTVDTGGYCTTSGTSVTAVTNQAQSFTGLTGTIAINGTNYTISSVTNSTQLVLTGSAGTNSTPVRFTHPGTAVTVTVADATGWQDGDELAFAPTSRTPLDYEKRTIATGGVSGNTITLTSALSNVHQGNASSSPPIQAEVINLTRNVKIHGASSSLQGYIRFGSTTTVVMDYVQCYYLGSVTTNKRGIDIQTTTGSCTITNCTHHDSAGTSLVAFYISGSTANNITLQNNGTYNIANTHFQVDATTGTNITIDGNYAIGLNSSTYLINLADVNITCTNNRVSGCQSGTGIRLQENTQGALGNISNNIIHSVNSGFAYDCHLNPVAAVVSGFTIYRCTSIGVGASFTFGGVTCDDFLIFGCASAGAHNFASNLSPNPISMKNSVLAGDTVFSQPVGLLIGSGGSNSYCRIENTTFGVAGGLLVKHSTADINITGINSSTQIDLINCLLDSVTDVNGQTNLTYGGYVTSQRHDQTAGLHKTWCRTGTLTIDTTIYNTASPSLRMTPNNASVYLDSAGYAFDRGMLYRVDNGATLSPTVKVRKSNTGSGDSATYNGADNSVRLVLKANAALGITSDTVIATSTSSSNGAWETLTGTTPAATDAGIMEFVVECLGTTGWINVDDWGPNVGNELKYWFNGLPSQDIFPAGGGTTIAIANDMSMTGLRYRSVGY